MAGAAGRVEDFQVPRVFLGSIGDVDRLTEEFLLAQVLVGQRFRGLFPFLEKYLHGPADQVLAFFHKRRPALPHLVPDPPERVVGQELDHVARREELVADGQLAAVAGACDSSRICRRSSWLLKYW